MWYSVKLNCSSQELRRKVVSLPLDMHFMSQHRFNPRMQRDEGYYRIKESFRDLTDHHGRHEYPWREGSHESNHPKSTVLFKFFALPYFAGKKAMFNLNENNRIVMSQHPSDMRIGVNGMCGQVRKVGLDPSNGDVYIFVGRSRQLMKILHWERGGYVMYYKRLEQGRFHPRIFLREGIGFRTMRWDELVLLMEGISPKVARRKRFPNPNGKLELSRKK